MLPPDSSLSPSTDIQKEIGYLKKAQTGTQLREMIKFDKPSVFLSSVYSYRFQDPRLLDVTLSATGGKVISYTKNKKKCSVSYLAFVFIGKSRCLACSEFNYLFVVIFSFITLFPHLLIWINEQSPAIVFGSY